MRTISVLPLEKMFFIKKISLEDTISSEVVCYARKLSEAYRMNPNKSARDKHLYLGYTEEEYPCDDLDKAILKQIRVNFPEAKSHTSIMMFNVDKEDNTRWLEQYKKEILHVSVVYSPTSGSLTGADVCQKEIEVLSFPVMRGRQRGLNTSICIVTDKPEKYRHLSSLLKETYNLFSDVCKK